MDGCIRLMYEFSNNSIYNATNLMVVCKPKIDDSDTFFQQYLGRMSTTCCKYILKFVKSDDLGFLTNKIPVVVLYIGFTPYA